MGEYAMTLTCYNCKKPRHKMKDCKQLMEKSYKSSNEENTHKEMVLVSQEQKPL